MRVAEFSDSFLPIVDGVGTVVYHYVTQMAQKGHQTYAVAPMDAMGFRGGYPFEILDYKSFPVPGMKNYRMGTPALDAHFKRRLRVVDLDIVHVHSPFIAGRVGLRCARRRHIPIVGTFHSKYYDDFLQKTGSKAIARAGAKYVADFYSGCDEVWAVTKSSAETFREYGYKKEIFVMPNGTDVRPLPASAVEAASRHFELGPEPVLLFVGQMNWKKNIRLTLEVAARLQEAGRSFQLVLAGQGPHKDEILMTARQLGLTNRLIYVGHVSDPELLDGLYARAALFCFPSIYDNGPLVVREAAAMGTPSVTVRGSSAAEGIEDGVNGYLCENDVEDMLRVVDAALADPESLAAVGRKARETIPVPWSRLVDTVLERYQRLIDARNANPVTGHRLFNGW